MSKSRNQHVVRHNDSWAVRAEGSQKVSKEFDIKADAVNWGRKVAQNQQSELFIHGKNGQIQDRDSYGNDPCPPKDKKH
jgi:hypothetical protein